MAILDRITLKNIFKPGAKPTAAVFANWMDSFWHKNDPINLDQVRGLAEELNNKISTEDKTQILTALKTQEDTWNELKEQTVLKYNDAEQTVASDVIRLVDSNTGENVNYRETTTWYDGSAMNDSKVDGLLYKKISAKYYKLQSSEINVLWFGNNSDAIQSAIDASLLSLPGGLKLQALGVYLPTADYIIDKPIIIRSVQGFNLRGSGAGTRLLVSSTLDSVFDCDGIAYSRLGDFLVTGNGGAVDTVIKLRWNDGTATTGGAARSTTKNKLENIHIHGETNYVNGIWLMGHNQNDETECINISIGGDNSNHADRFVTAYKVGDGTTGNNLAHTFIDCMAFGVENCFEFAGVGGVIIGRGAQNCKRYIYRVGSNETLIAMGARIEGVERIFVQKNINNAGDNVTLKNIHYSGLIGATGIGAPVDGIIIDHKCGNINIEGCTFVDPNPASPFIFSLKNAAAGTGNSVITTINVVGLCIERDDIEGLFDAWSGTKSQVNVIGLNLLDAQKTLKGSYQSFSLSLNHSPKTVTNNYYTAYGETVNFCDKTNPARSMIFYQDANSHISGNGSSGLYIENFPIVAMGNLIASYRFNEFNDNEAPDGILYFSTTRGKLCYKYANIINELY